MRPVRRNPTTIFEVGCPGDPARPYVPGVTDWRSLVGSSLWVMRAGVQRSISRSVESRWWGEWGESRGENRRCVRYDGQACHEALWDVETPT